LLDMNESILVPAKEVCLLGVQRIRQDGINHVEASTFERRPLGNNVLRSMNDCVIGGTCQQEYGQCHEVYGRSPTRINVNEGIILAGKKIHVSAVRNG
jgi:hypothetical protein